MPINLTLNEFEAGTANRIIEYMEEEEVDITFPERFRLIYKWIRKHLNLTEKKKKRMMFITLFAVGTYIGKHWPALLKKYNIEIQTNMLIPQFALNPHHGILEFLPDDWNDVWDVDPNPSFLDPIKRFNQSRF
jgi:hypothetical protein